MKKVLSFTFILLFFATYCCAYTGLKENQLPDNIKSFIKTYFYGNFITFAVKNNNEYKIHLTNGTMIEFDINGAWKKVETKQKFPVNILPKHIISSIKKSYPNTYIIMVERMWNGYKIKFNNMTELFINKNGSITQK